MTGLGTNSYLVGRADLVAIDPGPQEPAHLRRLLELAGGRLRYVLVTHSHRDHAPGAGWLAAQSGATLLAFGARAGFDPDGLLGDGDLVRGEGFEIEALHTPGHSSDHLCYLLRSPQLDPAFPLLFSGDHVMGGSTVVISPPDGDMAAYLASIERLLALDPPIGAIAPGHGELLADPRLVLRSYLEHRLAREATVLGGLGAGPATARELVGAIYPGLAPSLESAAARQIWAHLRKLEGDGVARSEDPDDLDARWWLSSR
jgi:glyoxylase-like metal-dependent hydrolase (beta-lactamase superfamily II)